jgi:Tol biopolymer transport system component
MNRSIFIFHSGILTILFILSSCGRQQTADQSPVDATTDWRYFGQKLPDNNPRIFSPDIISTRRNERDITFAPAGNVIFYSLVMPANNLNVILYLSFDGFFWSKPEIASFSGIYNDLEPSYSPDGKKFFFISNRPLATGKGTKDYHIWFLEPEKGWNNPVNVGLPVSSEEKGEYYPSVSSAGNLYFTANYEDSFGEDDIYYSRFINGKYQSPVNLGEVINSAGYDFNSFIAPDESYLIFSSFGREDEIGGGDLYIAYSGPGGSWSKPRNLGPMINSDRLDFCPYVTQDEKYLFFTSQRENSGFKSKQPRKLADLLELADGIENGLGNIYWVEFNKNAWK